MIHIQNALFNYFNFNGRARRKEYWLFILFYYVFLYLLVVVDVLLNFTITESDIGFLTISWIVLLFIPNLSVTVRRLHDTGRSGLLIFLIFIPLIGGIWLFVLTLLEGDQGRNKYGNDPKEDFN